MILSAKYLGADETSVVCDMSDHQISGDVANIPGFKDWLAAGNTPEPMYTLAAAQAKKITEVKANAKRKIEAIVPQDIQLRTLTRGLLLTKKIIDGVATADEIAEAQIIQDVDTHQLQPVRDASNLIEAEIMDEKKHPTAEAVLAVDVAGHPAWP